MSASVFAQPVEKRTLPSGKLPSVLCAEGAQCRPQRVSMPNSRSSRQAASALSQFKKPTENTPVRLPGHEFTKLLEENRRNGITVDDSVWAKIQAL